MITTMIFLLDTRYQLTSKHVTAFMDEHPEINFVDKDIFFSCKKSIMPMLNMSVLIGYMIKYDMMQNDDLITLANPHLTSLEKENSLIKMIEEIGPKGFMLLHMCLLESSPEDPLHKEAATILGRKGKCCFLNVV